MTFALITHELSLISDPDRALHSSRFFKTGPGEYGAGDLFLGIPVPAQRIVARQFRSLNFVGLQKLLGSPYHEHRLTALFILVDQYKKCKDKKIVDFYLRNLYRVNNWDLVDSSAHYILGDWLLLRDRAVLYRLVCSKNLWERRVAVLSTFAFIRAGEFKETFALCEILLSDSEDLMHKACGWMLREVGKRDEKLLLSFLDKHASVMPRTMLRYSLEKLSPSLKKKYMSSITL